jgi:hypothetical protein
MTHFLHARVRVHLPDEKSHGGTRVFEAKYNPKASVDDESILAKECKADQYEEANRGNKNSSNVTIWGCNV